MLSSTQPQNTNLGSPLSCHSTATAPTGQNASPEHRATQDTRKSQGKGVCNTLAWEKLQRVLSLLKQDRWLYQGRVTSAPLQAVRNSYISQMTADFLWVGL